MRDSKISDNKVRLSQDVIKKAEVIAAEWGLKNARAAVEAVFRRYSDEYLYGRNWSVGGQSVSPYAAVESGGQPNLEKSILSPPSQLKCEALDELDQLLAA